MTSERPSSADHRRPGGLAAKHVCIWGVSAPISSRTRSLQSAVCHPFADARSAIAPSTGARSWAYSNVT
jgi:hypothetical protein